MKPPTTRVKCAIETAMMNAMTDVAANVTVDDGSSVASKTVLEPPCALMAASSGESPMSSTNGVEGGEVERVGGAVVDDAGVGHGATVPPAPVRARAAGGAPRWL